MSTTSSMTEDYLKALYSAQERGEDGLGVTELARRMGVVASTASENVRKMDKQGLVEHAPYQRVHLTEKGQVAAVAIIRRHRLLEAYLCEKLGFDWDEVHREAEELEHAVSDTLLERMDQVLGYPVRDPHGDPIPRLDGSRPSPPPLPLSEAVSGTLFLVARISDDDPALLRHLESLGLVLDSQIEIRERLDFAGTTRVSVTPPPAWQPRSPAALAQGVAPGATSNFDLSDVCVQAVWVLS